MRERPILFSTPMVRALLEGRKTQTRRIVKPQPQHPLFARHHMLAADDEGVELFLHSSTLHTAIRCPFGPPGDRLWVRETCLGWWNTADGSFSHAAAYKADGYELEHGERWIPSIHMPRKASRITLEITGVRVERLNGISAADAIAEGIHQTPDCGPEEWAVENLDYLGHSPQESFCELIEDINGAGTWNANPWVWVVEFRRLTA